MDTKALLEQLLESGRELADQGIAQGTEIVEKGKLLVQQGAGLAEKGKAFGGIGYKVYSQWQKSQGAEVTGLSIENLVGDEANARSMAIVKAMIGAAKADGEIDEAERAIIIDKINESDLEQSATEILLSDLLEPLDVDAIAAASDSPESAVEIYLASLILTDKSNSVEQSYLEKLSKALKLDPQLVSDLEAQAFAPA